MDKNTNEDLTSSQVQVTVLPGNNNQQIAIFLGGAILLLVLLGAVYSSLKLGTQSINAPVSPAPPESKVLNLAPYTLVYGNWDSNGSSIKALDLTSGQSYLLANLPSNVKKVSVLDSNTLLYIDNTDTKDHGTQLAIYDIKKKISTPDIRTTDGFGIDDYVLSPNKRYLADWEVVASSSGALLGGKSRVYTIDLQNPSVKHLIYDETADHPVHYPRGILNNGTVYTDTFLPNSGAGWAYGMSVSNFDGSQKQDLPNMQNGTYGTQPELSPDGKYFVFAGYDGKYGSGTKDVNGYRLALVKPDIISLLNTQNNEITTLPEISNSNTYSAVHWNNTSNNIVYTQLSTKSNDLGTYTYNPKTHNIQKINLETDNVLISMFSDTNYIKGQSDTSSQILGNLGSGYDLPVSNLQAVNTSSNQHSPLPISEPLIQFIEMDGKNYFTNTAQVFQNSKSAGNNQLQFQTFVIKPSLKPVRTFQQSAPILQSTTTITPINNDCSTSPQGCSQQSPSVGVPEKCDEMLRQQCLPPDYTGPLPNVFNSPQSYQNCVFAAQKANPGVCPGSPLYLYGPSGMKIQVKIITPVYGSSPPYHNGYTMTLEDNGLMDINGNSYSKISYNYESAVKHIVPPKYGSIITTNQLSQTLQDYAIRLGLNQKETNNLIADSRTEISSPYVFVSFFDHNTSKAILPIQFSPQPETYRNIVFYFKQLDSNPNVSIPQPNFEKIQRKGLTAVEISEIVD